MPTVKDALTQVKFLIEKGMENEPAVLYMPRVEARKRKSNLEKRKRIIWDVDEANYSRFNAERDRWIGIAVNKTVAVSLMVDVLAAVPEETIRKLLEAGNV
jgi:hypothetical protein